MSMRPGGQGWEVVCPLCPKLLELFKKALFGLYMLKTWKNKPKLGNHPIQFQVPFVQIGGGFKRCVSSPWNFPDDDLCTACDRFWLFFLSFWWFGLPSSGVFLFTVLRLPNKCLTKFQYSTPPWKLIYMSPQKRKGTKFKKEMFIESSNQRSYFFSGHMWFRTFPGPKGRWIEAWLRHLEPGKMVGFLVFTEVWLGKMFMLLYFEG